MRNLRPHPRPTCKFQTKQKLCVHKERPPTCPPLIPVPRGNCYEWFPCSCLTLSPCTEQPVHTHTRLQKIKQRCTAHAYPPLGFFLDLTVDISTVVSPWLSPLVLSTTTGSSRPLGRNPGPTALWLCAPSKFLNLTELQFPHLQKVGDETSHTARLEA